jgi:hypothetical protein
LKLVLHCAPTRAAAREAFDYFIAGNPDDADVELGSFYYASTLYRLEGSDAAA